MPKSIVPQVTLYQDTYAILEEMTKDSGLLPEHLAEELVNYFYYSLFQGDGRKTGQFQELAPLLNFRKVYMPMRAQTYERFHDLLRTFRITSENLIRWVVEYHGIVISEKCACTTASAPTLIYEDTLTLLRELAEESELSTGEQLSRFIHKEYLLRYGTSPNPEKRLPRYAKRNVPDRGVKKISIDLHQDTHERLSYLLTEDCLPAEEMLEWIIRCQDVARHVHYLKAARRNLAFKCGRKNCCVEY